MARDGRGFYGAAVAPPAAARLDRPEKIEPGKMTIAPA